MRKTFYVLGLVTLLFSIGIVWSASQTFEFTTAGEHTLEFTVPTAAFNLRISELVLIGGGGGGGNGGSAPLIDPGGTGGGGGSGYPVTKDNLVLDKSKNYSFTIGEGGGATSAGQPTLLKINGSTIYTADGGQGGSSGTMSSHGTGGAGYNYGANGAAGGGGGTAYYVSYGSGGNGGAGQAWGFPGLPGASGATGYVKIVISYDVSGSAKDEQIMAASNNIVITGVDFSRTAAADNINDAELTVLEINGLVEEKASYNAAELGNFSNNIYKSLVPGEIYSVEVVGFSRGNDTKDGDIIQIAVDLDDTGADTWLNNEPATTNIYPWQLVGFSVTVNPVGAYAYEKATLNTTISLVGGSAPRIVSYNAFESAYLGGTYEGKGVYGGIATMAMNTFILETEGYDLTILSRSSTLNAPAGYNGEAITVLNIVPGTKITYTIVIKNNSMAEATSINLKDQIPANCHLYYTEAPSVVGAGSWAWQGATDNSADQNTADAVKFEITIPAEGTVTASYSVTVD